MSTEYPPDFDRESYVPGALDVSASDEAMSVAVESFFLRHMMEGKGLGTASRLVSSALLAAVAEFAKYEVERTIPPPF